MFLGLDVISGRNCHCRTKNCIPISSANPLVSERALTVHRCRVRLLMQNSRRPDIPGRRAASLNALAESWISFGAAVLRSRYSLRLLCRPVHDASGCVSVKCAELSRCPLVMASCHLVRSDGNGHDDPRRCWARHPAKDPPSMRGRVPTDVVNPSYQGAVLCCYNRDILRIR